MDVMESIKTRRSVRKFQEDRPVEEDKLQGILEALRLAPSWANMQCWRLIVVRDAQSRARLSELSFVEEFFAPLGYKSNPAMKALAEAPIVLVVCADPKKSGTLRGQDYYLTDVGIATENLMLSAHDQGLGTVFVGVFDEEKVRELLNIPPEIRVVGLFPLGYPQEQKEGGGTPRKSLEEIVHQEKWS